MDYLAKFKGLVGLGSRSSAEDRFLSLQGEGAGLVELGLLANEFSQAWAVGDAQRSEQALAAFRHLRDQRWPLQPAARATSPLTDSTTVFAVDVLFVQQAVGYILDGYTPTPPRGFQARGEEFLESFVYVTGLQFDSRTFVLTHLIPVAFDEQTSGGVRVNDASNSAALAMLDAAGLPLVCHLHSHPSTGIDATQPSGIDRAYQARLERGGHVAIGGIFSQDGYLRFFAGDPNRFVVRIHGKGIVEVEQHVFKLDLAHRGF